MAPKITGIVFDMDGLMIDSEPLWHIAETKCFKKVGVTLKEENCNETTGLRLDEAVNHHFRRVGGWDQSICSQQQLCEDIIKEMEALLQAKGSTIMKPGLLESLEFFESLKLPMTVASSSATNLIEAGLKGLGVRERFSSIYSAADEEYGKPHPAVYLSAAKGMGLDPTTCLALEDSVNGALSAKAARMKVIAIPEVFENHKLAFHIADAILPSLNDVEGVWKTKLGQE